MERRERSIIGIHPAASPPVAVEQEEALRPGLLFAFAVRRNPWFLAAISTCPAT